jgi:hypothetical protein
MGNEPAPIEQKGKKLNVLLVMEGIVTAEVADDFRDDLNVLVAKYKPLMGNLTRPIKKASKSKAQTKKKVAKKKRKR